MYLLEQALVDDFIATVAQPESSPWGNVRLTTQFLPVRWRTDIVALNHNGELLAFEAKLKKWRYALHQAYRNTCFVNRSYVLLPEQVALYAMRYTNEITKYSVGLCYISNGMIVIAQQAPYQRPIQEWLAREAISLLT